MEAEIKAEFTNNGFTFDNEEDILQKCETFFSQFVCELKNLGETQPFACLFELSGFFRSNLLHTVQAQCFRPCIQLGSISSQQVFTYFIWRRKVTFLFVIVFVGCFIFRLP